MATAQFATCAPVNNAEAPAPHSSETIYVVNADPRAEPKPLPVFPNPGCRPAGLLQPLVLRFQSDVPRGIDVAQGRHARRDAAGYLRAIDGAGNRSIKCEISCAGGESESAIAITRALLKHPYSVTAKISRCSSAAVFIALAADERVIESNGTVLIHQAARICTHDQWAAIQRLQPREKQAISDALADIDAASEALLTARLGISREVARRWLKEDRKWSAPEALARGFVDVIAAEEAA